MKKMRFCIAAFAAMTMFVFMSCGEKKTGAEGGIKEFTAFFAVPGSEINNNNDIQNIIAERTGVRVKESWLTGQTAKEAIGIMIAGGVYPDMIDGATGMIQLYEAGALVPLDDYIDKYPNIKNYFTPFEWEQLRQDDGHIYWIQQFGNLRGEEQPSSHNDWAFWIQTRVLKWAGYPKITTMDEYFDLLERYNAANPTMADGTPNIPYTILSDDWRFFSLDAAPLMLDGYMNDTFGVDPNTREVVDYNVTPTAKKYFQKLNEEWQKGIIDTQAFTQSYDQYLAKLSTGRVLGMIDQWWNFAYTVNDALKVQGLDEEGCNYIPLAITIEPGMKQLYHRSGGVLNAQKGLAITTSCKDVEGALQFINDLLDQDIHNLRMWGVEGVDYMVGEDGRFYRTPEQRALAADASYKASHLCTYNYFPQYTGSGTSADGINAMKPEGQPSEFFDSMSNAVKDTLTAYGTNNFVDLLGGNPPPGPWYPLYSYSDNMTTATPGGLAKMRIDELKKEQLPRVVMASNFEAAWANYLQAYNNLNPQAFLNEIQAELDRRVEMAAKYQ